MFIMNLFLALNFGFQTFVVIHCNPIQDRLANSTPEHDIEIIKGTRLESVDKIIMSPIDGNSKMFFTFVEPTWRASAYLIPESGDVTMRGAVHFRQYSPKHYVRVSVNISGLPPGIHTIHIHEFGDISRGCRSTGPHIPNNFIGNIEASNDGNIAMSFYSSFLNLFGYSGIVGRSVLVHSNPLNKNHYPNVFSSNIAMLSPAQYTDRDEEKILGPPLMCGVITLTDNRKH